MKQETVVQQPAVPQPKTKVRTRETTYAGKIGDWQRLLGPLAANAADFPHLDVPRAKLAALVTQTMEFKKQQDAARANKQNSSQTLQGMIADGQRLAALLRQAVKQHYGPRSEKLAEFNLKPFRGRAKSATTTPEAVPPAATPTATPVPTADSTHPA